MQGGEPGDPESIDPLEIANPNSPLSECTYVEDQLRSLHWSVIGLFNLKSPASAIERWKRDGCFDEFNLKLGYRFRMVDLTAPTSVDAGSSVSMGMTMANDGYARPYNPRSVEVVFRNQESGAVTRMPVRAAEDARLWLPGAEQSTSFTTDIAVPAGLAAGKYDVLLNMPDPKESLNSDPAFSIQLANTGTWEAATGYNDLLTAIEVR